MQRPPTQRAGGMHLGLVVALQAAPSAAAAEQVPPMTALQVPLAGHTA